MKFNLQDKPGYNKIRAANTQQTVQDKTTPNMNLNEFCSRERHTQLRKQFGKAKSVKC